MKFKAIERLVKAEGYIALLDERVEGEESVTVARQWMGDGRAFYPLDGLPMLTEEGVLVMFDIDAKKREKIVFHHEAQLPESVCFADLSDEDVLLEPYDIKITVNGAELLLLKDEADKLICIQRKYLTPFEKLKELELYRRRDANGVEYVAVKIGCILRGIVYVYAPADDKFVETVGAIYNAAALALADEKARRTEQMRI
ncbi:MAG: hypothetical protein E7589_01350 [Ruminococcaceae bacterium]|nr:hypothetical protein [Oscillospiraceae bacterium]